MSELRPEFEAATKFLKSHFERVDSMPPEWHFAQYETNKVQVNWLAEAFREFSKEQLAQKDAQIAGLVEALGKYADDDEWMGIWNDVTHEYGDEKKYWYDSDDATQIAKIALAALPASLLETHRLEREVIEAAGKFTAHYREAGFGVIDLSPHNPLKPFLDAVEALQAHKENG